MSRIELSPELSSRDIAGLVRADHRGPEVAVRYLTSADRIGAGGLCFVTSARFAPEPDRARGGVVICNAELAGSFEGGTVLVSDAPRLAFARIAAGTTSRTAGSQHPTAVVDPTATVDPSAVLGPHVVVGPGCRIGARAVIGAGTVLVEDAVVDDDVVIGQLSVIGDHGFGFERDPESGQLLRFPHIGGVTIGARSQIGSLTCVARGTFSPTVIGHDVQVDSHVFIAHNVVLGPRSAVVAGAEVSGSVIVGEDAWIGPQATIRDGLEIGARTLVGMGSVVVKSVPADTTVKATRPVPADRDD